MGKNYIKFKGLWETYNGFALLAMILGILCHFFGWFKAGSFSIYIRDLLFIDQTSVLLSLLFFLGFLFLNLYYTSSLLRNTGGLKTSFDKHSKIFFFLSSFLFIFFMGFMYLYFYPGTACFGLGGMVFFCLCEWEIHIGFILGVIMTSLLLISFSYEAIMLRRHYQEHLPEYAPF